MNHGMRMPSAKGFPSTGTWRPRGSLYDHKGTNEMIVLDDIIDSIRAQRIRITDHADEEAHDDDLTFEEVVASVLAGEIIEQYSEDRPYPSCLIYGKNKKGEDIHSVWAYNDITKAAVLVTVYRPDPTRWIDGKVRRKP